jgi:N-acetylmuramoyl-L-alanine amidase
MRGEDVIRTNPRRPGWQRHRDGVGLRWLLTVLLVCLLPLAGSSASLRELQDVHFRTSLTETQVIIELDGAVSYQIGRLSTPSRLYIDLPNTFLPPDWHQRKVKIADGRVQAIRIALNRPRQVRIVLDMQTFEEYLIYAQPHPYRITVVLRGKPAAADRHTKAPQSPPRDLPASPAARPTIVIDPGHGGKDPGAIGRGGLQEKTVVLRVAKELRQIMRQALPYYRIVMTRKRDVFVPLRQRAEIANKYPAQLFVSLHVNASRKRAAHGIETWYLSFAASERAKRRAARENQMSEAQLSDLEIILRDMHETDRINQSATLASVTQKHLVTHMARRYRGIPDRGVEGAPFIVLLHTSMPSVLVELAFISNPHEERRLRSRTYQRTLAEGIFRGIRRFLRTSVAAAETERDTIR